MAYDDDLRVKVRAYYECNTLSYPKVTQHFVDLGYDVSVKTVQAWGAKEKWEKNKYKSIEDAIESLLPPEILDNITTPLKEKIRQQMADEATGVIKAEVLENYAEEVTEELLYQTLSKYGLQQKLVASLNRANKIAEDMPHNMQVQATNHSMIIATIQTIHGKKVEMIPQDPNSKIMSDKQMNEMSREELKLLAEG